MPDSAGILSLAAKNLHKVDATIAVVPKNRGRRGRQLTVLRLSEAYVECPCQQGQKPLVHRGRQDGSWWAGAGGQEEGTWKKCAMEIIILVSLSKREGSVQHGNTNKNNVQEGGFTPTSFFVVRTCPMY